MMSFTDHFFIKFNFPKINSKINAKRERDSPAPRITNVTDKSFS